ncbi:MULTISPECIES: putative holin-like toxin [Bacillus]|nr:putative holin-like toxin [Bacillus subtilis]MBW7636285.1 putative holin-like toxin [Bacillus licheniformis]MEC0413583.1 putative holin-like toxin [Bacillus subtilis]MEC0423243.1 putative holin-like toxin [Bacillus subtilis]WGT45850.1 putative holin-like toxin [Bacillus subtilis subsp. subtilis]
MIDIGTAIQLMLMFGSMIIGLLGLAYNFSKK